MAHHSKLPPATYTVESCEMSNGYLVKAQVIAEDEPNLSRAREIYDNAIGKQPEDRVVVLRCKARIIRRSDRRY